MTSGVVKWSLSTDPIAWNLTGEFLFKDVVLLVVCTVLFLFSFDPTHTYEESFDEPR
jgi:hypothetical protein